MPSSFANELAANDFVKVLLIKAFIIAQKFESVCLSESFLDSAWWNINNDGYLVLKIDHLNNMKRGGACIYFKEFLPLIRQNDIDHMKECLVTEIDFSNKKCFFAILL